MPLFEDYYPEPKNSLPHLTGLKIRVATIDDAETIASISTEREGEGELEEISNKARKQISRLHRDKSGIVFIAELDTEAIGFAKVIYFKPLDDAPANIAPSGWYLAGIVVKPEFRRQGVADKLTQARIEWLSCKTDTVYYFANARNAVSIELHEKHGFAELTRDFVYPEATFEGGEGVLFKLVFDSWA